MNPIRKKIKEILQEQAIGAQHHVQGWIKTKRTSKKIVFLIIHDGSCQENLQVVFESKDLPESLDAQLNTGASVAVQGKLVASQGANQEVELHGKHIHLLGGAPDYPIQSKAHSLEFLRTLPHLRFRTQTFGAIFRVRDTISYAIHKFFHKHNFYYVHTPIITSIDAEGAGTMFQVTGLDIFQQNEEIDPREDFFKKSVNLTVSGQLTAEAAAMGLGSVYTFGPAFRAENSNTKRHLAEFWMVEAEAAFMDLDGNIDLAEQFLKFVIHYVLQNSASELNWLHTKQTNRKDKSQTPLLAQLEEILSYSFPKITYTEAIDILKHASKSNKAHFDYPIDCWGVDLQAEHEQYLVEKHFSKPVVITDYPKGIKAFYMRQNDDGKTVAAMDILFPGIGEIIGGSQREERIDLLISAMENNHMNMQALDWYLDTRRFGNVPHSGFGLGLERLVMFVTGTDNIRDVIPFPRTPGHADC